MEVEGLDIHMVVRSVDNVCFNDHICFALLMSRWFPTHYGIFISSALHLLLVFYGIVVSDVILAASLDVCLFPFSVEHSVYLCCNQVVLSRD